MKSVKLTLLPLLFISVVQTVWAASVMGAAHTYRQCPTNFSLPIVELSTTFPKSALSFPRPTGLRQTVSEQQSLPSGPRSRIGRSKTPDRIPTPASFRVVRDRGLLVRTWINGSGPYTFAIDTGAGGTIISERLAATLDISIHSGRPVSLAGLSGRERHGGHEGFIKTLALGQAENLLPANHAVIVSAGLPRDIDGILDPTEAYSPLGYVIDIPGSEIEAFDCALHPLSTRNPPAEGAVVHWLIRGESRRPFISLDDGRLALLDTGSAFGLAVTQNSRAHDGRYERRVQDIGGGSVTSSRADEATVSIGALTLRRVPTDILSGVEKGTPVLLGRAALYPFRLAFDPLHKLIAIGPSER